MIAGKVKCYDRPHRHLNLSVPVKFQRQYSSSSLSSKDVGAGTTDRYLPNFVHPALYNLLQVLGVHYGEIECHLSLIYSLHTMPDSL